MSLKEIGKNYNQVQNDLNESVKEFVKGINKRIKRGIVNEGIWHSDIPLNLDRFYVEQVSEFDGYMVFTIYRHDPYDDMHESFDVKYLDIYQDMTLTEISDHIMVESVKLNKEDLIREVKFLEEDLKIVKERLNGLD